MHCGSPRRMPRTEHSGNQEFGPLTPPSGKRRRRKKKNYRLRQRHPVLPFDRNNLTGISGHAVYLPDSHTQARPGQAKVMRQPLSRKSINSVVSKGTRLNKCQHIRRSKDLSRDTLTKNECAVLGSLHVPFTLIM